MKFDQNLALSVQILRQITKYNLTLLKILNVFMFMFTDLNFYQLFKISQNQEYICSKNIKFYLFAVGFIIS